MELKQGYKQTEVGIIPLDWKCLPLMDLVYCIHGKAHEQYIEEFGKYIVVNSKFISTDGNIRKFSNISFCTAIIGDVLTVLSDLPNGKALAKCFAVHQNNTFAVNQRVCIWRPKTKVDSRYLFYVLNRNRYFLSLNDGVSQTHILKHHIEKCRIQLPATRKEQTAIATALSDIDELISQTENLISKKKAIKQGAMQELLKPKEGWVTKKLGEVCDVLDNLRKPLNDSERQSMKGDIPYCGANGIVGFVNDYVIDDDIILMAEDGGYFDEYKTRPIAYQMNGKCWVNNHAHILKSKKDYDQNFIFYSLVNKNILDYINGGTRAKLNKGEMVNIVLSLPQNIIEQTKIAKVFIDLSQNIAMLETKLIKLKDQKQGMMQALLTGKIRLL